LILAELDRCLGGGWQPAPGAALARGTRHAARGTRHAARDEH